MLSDHGVFRAPIQCSPMTLSHPGTNDLSRRVIGAAIEVHRQLGPGLLESIYEECLHIEFETRGLSVTRQASIPIVYKGHAIEAVYRPDLIVNKTIIVEVKSVEKVVPVHKAQVLTYLKISSLPLGLILNFNTEILAHGITRISL